MSGTSISSPHPHLSLVLDYLRAIERDVSEDELSAFFAPGVKQHEFPNRLVERGAERGLEQLLEGSRKGRLVVQNQRYQGQFAALASARARRSNLEFPMLAHSLRGLTAALLAVLVLGTANAHAEEDAATRAAARKLAEDGVAALQNGDAATAVQKLEKAHNMLKAPSVALWSARALAKRGLLVEAAERLREASRLPVSGDAGVQEQAKREAEKELGELSPRIPSLVIAIGGAGDAPVSITLDGAAIPSDLLGEDRPVNPGAHRLVAKRGADERSLDITVAEGERKPANLDFGSAAPTPASPAGAPATDTSVSTTSSGSGAGNKTLAFVALGAGAAGLIVGGVTGGLALSKKSKLDDNAACLNGECTYAVESDVKSLRAFRTVSTIGFIAGGVLAATGVVLLVTSGGSQPQGAARRPHVALAVGPGNLQLAGSF